MTQVYDPAGVRLFSFFAFDASRICGKLDLATDKVQPNEDLSGEDLYTFRPVVRTDKTVDFSALSADELARLQDDERRARAELLAEKFAALGNVDEESEDMPEICSLIPPPLYSADAIRRQAISQGKLSD